ncbi:hypothetical protein ACA910_003537 [Epithemia clementina (nom. ined.)]
MYYCHWRWLLAATAASSLYFPHMAFAEEVLRQVLVVTRHGSRLPLRKSGQDLSESTPGMLTALGQLQHYELGQYLYRQYNASGLFGPFVDRNKIRLQSSSFERTITSANSFALGLFDQQARDPNSESELPGGLLPANVPVYTYELINDVWIRAYDKCPTYEKRLNDLYQSAEWTTMENDNTDLLAALSKMPDFETFADDRGIVPLSELWNVFDLINVAETECGTLTAAGEPSAACKSLTTSSVANVQELLTAEQWATVQALSHQAEQMKYGDNVAGSYVGANLLAEIADRMQKDNYTFSLFSAHYPTILGMMAALGDDFFDDEVIPSYAAALVFEMRQDTSTGIRNFQVHYVADDLPDNAEGASLLVAFDKICPNNSGGSCPVSELVKYLNGWTVAQWCKECENDSASACMKLQLDSFTDGSVDGAADGGTNNDDDSELSSVAIFFIGLAAGVAAMVVVVVIMWVAQKNRKQQMESRAVGGKLQDTTDLGGGGGRMMADDEIDDSIEGAQPKEDAAEPADALESNEKKPASKRPVV